MWEPGDLTYLAIVFAEFYPDVNSARRVVQEAQQDTSLISFDPRSFFNWVNILWAVRARSNGIDRLLEIAKHEYPTSTKLERVIQLQFVSQAPNLDGTRGIRDLEHTRHNQISASPSASDITLLSRRISVETSIVPIGLLAVGVKHARAVARVTSLDGMGMASGFLIADNLFVTSDFVLPDVNTARGAVVQFGYEESVVGTPDSMEEHRLLPDEYFRVFESANLSVVRVEGNANERWGQLDLVPVQPQIGDVVTIVQHAYGQYKSTSSSVIANVTNDAVQYLCDTAPGSSGAPVFDHHWNVVAVHQRKIMKPDRGVKEGVHIQALITALQPK